MKVIYNAALRADHGIICAYDGSLLEFSPTVNWIRYRDYLDPNSWEWQAPLKYSGPVSVVNKATPKIVSASIPATNFRQPAAIEELHMQVLSIGDT